MFENIKVNGFKMMSKDEFIKNMQKEISKTHMKQVEFLLKNNIYAFTTKPEIKDGYLVFQNLCNDSLELLRNSIQYHKLKGTIYYKDYSFNIERFSNIKEVI